MKIVALAIVLFWTISFALAAELPGSLTPRDKALIEGAFRGELADVQALVEKGASIAAVDSKNRTALMWAAANGHTSVVEFLHGIGADINAKDSDGQTALMYATTRLSAPTIEFLLNNDADINVQSKKQGFTALIIAAAAGDEKLVRLLLEHGADRDLAEYDGSTAADRARQGGYSDVVKLLAHPPST